MSTASGPSSSRLIEAGDGVKLSPPPEFWGQRSKFESWTIACELYFHTIDLVSERKIVFAVEYFRGKTDEWIRLRSKIFLSGDRDDTVRRFFLDWKTFKLETGRVFGIANDDKIAEQRIQSVRQTKSAAEYSAEFTRYVSDIGWDNKALQYMYKKRLKKEIKNEIMRHEYHTISEDQIDILRELMNVAIKLNNQLYECRLERNPKREKYTSQERPQFDRQSRNY